MKIHLHFNSKTNAVSCSTKDKNWIWTFRSRWYYRKSLPIRPWKTFWVLVGAFQWCPAFIADFGSLNTMKNHIGSGSNPDLGPDVPGRLFNLCFMWILFFFFSFSFGRILTFINTSQWEDFFEVDVIIEKVTQQTNWKALKVLEKEKMAKSTRVDFQTFNLG